MENTKTVFKFLTTLQIGARNHNTKVSQHSLKHISPYLGYIDLGKLITCILGYTLQTVINKEHDDRTTPPKSTYNRNVFAYGISIYK